MHAYDVLKINSCVCDQICEGGLVLAYFTGIATTLPVIMQVTALKFCGKLYRSFNLAIHCMRVENLTF